MTAQSIKKVPVQIGDGCAVSDDIAYLSGFPDALDEETKFTRLFALNSAGSEKWFHHDLHGHRVVSVCLFEEKPGTARAVCALSDDGTVEIANSAGRIFEHLAGAGLDGGSRGLGPMRRIREIDGRLYACGVGNQVYTRVDGMWTEMDQGISSSAANTIIKLDLLRASNGHVSEDDLLAMTQLVDDLGGLNDIAGLTSDDIYACGFNGALWHWNGQHWRRLETFTADHLHSIHVTRGGSVWIGGHNGTLLNGSWTTGFRRICGTEMKDHLWSVREFNDAVYLGTTRGLLSYDGQSLTGLRLPGQSSPPVIQAIDSTQDTLWVLSERNVHRLSGGNWETFDHPDNS